MFPAVSGAADLGYVNDALARADIDFRATELLAEALTEGRTAARVSRLRARSADGTTRSFVLKAVPPVECRKAIGADSSEARLLSSGATRALPAGLRCPTIDVARHSDDAWWILMEDSCLAAASTRRKRAG